MVLVYGEGVQGIKARSEINEYEANNYFKIDFVISRLNENFAIATVKKELSSNFSFKNRLHANPQSTVYFCSHFLIKAAVPLLKDKLSLISKFLNSIT